MLANERQLVSGDRQLADQAAAAAKDTPSRRNPRGRRLFVTDAAQKGTLA